MPPPTKPTGLIRKGVLDPAAFLAIRSALLLPQVMGLEASLPTASAAGRLFGKAPFNARRVSKAADRIALAFPELDAHARRDLVLSSYEHLFMLGCEIALVPRLLSEEAWIDHVAITNVGPSLDTLLEPGPKLLLTSHCGNWEVLGYALAVLGFELHALYRPLDLKPLDDWVRQTRGRRGLKLLDKFGAMYQLPAIFEAGGAAAIVADQNAGDRGLFVPFFGRLASTYKSIGLLAIKHRAKIIVGQARRVPPAPGNPRGLDYQIEMHDVIHPEEWESQPDPLFYLTARYRRALEQLIRRAPEQYLWMHRIWKSRPRHERNNKPFPDALKAKLQALPWMTQTELDSLIQQSDQDSAYLAKTGTQRLM